MSFRRIAIARTQTNNPWFQDLSPITPQMIDDACKECRITLSQHDVGLRRDSPATWLADMLNSRLAELGPFAVAGALTLLIRECEK